MKRNIICGLLTLLVASLWMPAIAQRLAQKLYITKPSETIYRIPAITCTADGTLIAVADNRNHHGNDAGYSMPIDIMYRLSHDNGKTWTQEQYLADCREDIYNGRIYGFSDAAIASDVDSDRQIALCVGDSTGRTVFQQGFQQVYRFYGTNNGNTWSKGENITHKIYSLVPQLKCLFIGSGKIHQSRYVKKGKYYRLYCSLISIGYGNAVIYSDDFGENWSLLGTTESCCPKGDEPKTEELPDGSVIISSRTKGRWFNIFRFDDKTYTSGHWENPVIAKDIICQQNACNGEIMGLLAIDTQTNKEVWLYLQSVPYGPKRTHVSIYYKPLPLLVDCKTITPENFGEGWERFEITPDGSAYSTFCMTADKQIAFLYERANIAGQWLYDICFEKLSIEQITHGRYTIK